MSDVKRVGERLECMLFRARFKEEVDELKPVSFKQNTGNVHSNNVRVL